MERRAHRRAAGPALVAVVAAAVVAVAVGCVPLSGGWSVAPLRERYPEILLGAGRRLGDTPPHFIPLGDAVVLFLCRFSKRAPISLSLPPDASADELSAIRTALEGWSNAGLGIRFAQALAQPAMIEIRFARPGAGPGALPGAGPRAGSGYTLSDCGFDAGWQLAADVQKPLPAQLVRASISLRRSKTDALGREVALSADELVGVLLHELGHALGFAGHVASNSSIMTRSTDTVRRFGRRLRAGRGFAAPSLAALYALPSGTVVGTRALVAADRALFEAASALARGRGWGGPFVRVGERNANLGWRAAGSRRETLEIRGYPEALRSGRPLAFSESPLERALGRALEPAL